MTDKEEFYFREVLRCLPFHGISIKHFAAQIHMTPHTLYNYISGQRPSEKAHRYILHVIGENYPEVLAKAKSMMEGDVKCI